MKHFALALLLCLSTGCAHKGALFIRTHRIAEAECQDAREQVVADKNMSKAQKLDKHDSIVAKCDMVFEGLKALYSIVFSEDEE